MKNKISPFCKAGPKNIFNILLASVRSFCWISDLTRGFLIIILLITGVILANVTSALIFFIVVPLCGMIPMILTPFFLGGIAKLDPSGSLAAAHPAFSTMGGAAGPVVMGYAIDMAGFPSIGWVLIVLVILGTPLLSLGLIEAEIKKGNKVTVVLSAMGNSTDDLIELAKDLKQK